MSIFIRSEALTTPTPTRSPVKTSLKRQGKPVSAVTEYNYRNLWVFLLRFRSLDNNVFSHLGSKDEKKTNHGHHDKSDHFRAQIESGMRDLDGPELLQFAIKFVQSALKKSQVGNQLNLQV